MFLNKGVLLCTAFLFFAGNLAAMSRPFPTQETDEQKRDAGIAEGVWLPPGLQEAEKAEWKNGVPPGWSRGEKRGWQGGQMPPGLARRRGAAEDTRPPGWSDWEAEQQQSWQGALEEIRERIRKAAGIPDKDTMIHSAESAAQRGVPPEILGRLTDSAINNRLTAEEYEKATRAMAYGADRDIDFGQLGGFVTSKIEQGVRGNDLAITIYKEIASRSER